MDFLVHDTSCDFSEIHTVDVFLYEPLGLSGLSVVRSSSRATKNLKFFQGDISIRTFRIAFYKIETDDFQSKRERP